MTAIPQPTPLISISDRVLKPLREVARRRWSVLAARGVLQTLAISLAILLVASLFLGFVPVPTALRFAIAIAAWLTILIVAVRCLRPTVYRNSLSRTARHVEQYLPHIDERLSSAVELSQEKDSIFMGSPSLVAHLVGQAEQDAAAINPAAIVPMDPVVRWGAIFLPVLLAWLIVSINGHTAQPVMRGLFNTLMPWRTHLPALLTEVIVRPGDVTLAQGDPLEITAHVTAMLGGREQATGKATLVRRFASGQTVTTALDAIGGRDFRSLLDNVQQGFTYQVTTESASRPGSVASASEWYTAVVHPRPAVARLDVHYDFPKYTGLAARDDIGRDGNVEAVVGTRITLTVHTPDSIVLDKSRVILDEGKREEQSLELTRTAGGEYQAKFDVTHSGEYRVHLVNEFALDNRDEPTRMVTAIFDQVPTVSILSPNSQVTVRPDDTVPVEYAASDDFGVDKIEALVQVDEKPQRTIRLTLPTGDRKDLRGRWTMSVPKLMAQAHVKEASRISYQLQVTDNRDPDPQIGVSARQMLVIDRNQWQTYADKLNDKRKQTLEQAIRKAIDRLNQSEWRTSKLKDLDDKHVLNNDERKEAREARDLLATTSRELSSAAAEFLDTPYSEVARKARDIADKPIAQSADDVAQAEFNADSPKERRALGEKARNEALDARQQLEKLIEATEMAQRKFEAQEALEQAARKQEEVAQAMAQHPENADQNRQKQQDAINKLNQAMEKDPSLRDDKARSLAQKLSELTQKIEQEQQQQTNLQNNTAKQEEAQQAKDAANALAEAQKKLNEEIQKFANDDKNPLQQSGANAPDKNQQENIVKQVEQNNLQGAAEAMRNAANQLKEDARKLADQAKNQNPNLSDKQKEQKQKDDQNQQAANGAKDQAKQTAGDLNNEANQNQVPHSDDGGIQAAQKAAEAVEKQADAVEAQNGAGPKDAGAQQAAEAAKADAQKAANEAKDAANAPNADEAKHKLQDAAKDLQKAGEEVAKAAEAEAKADQQAMATADQQAAGQAADQAKALADKQDELAKALAPEAQQMADAQNGALNGQQEGDQQNQLAQQTQQAEDAAHQLADQAKESKNPAIEHRAAEAQKALDDAAKAQKEAAKASTENKPDQAAEAQSKAQDALTKADSALRGDPELAQGEAGEKADGSEQANAEAGDHDGSESGQGHEPGQGKGTDPAHAGQEAAQAAQEAAGAQQQAMRPNPSAAQQAANALSRAAAAAAQANAGHDSGRAHAGEEGADHASEEADADAEGAHHPGNVPGHSADSHAGIRGSQAGGNNGPPASVEALGIGAGDWAKLPPLVQRELMNAAQQSGPPAYREMIKNYYVRIARLQDNGKK